ncbi:MAG: alpha/beta fold hydrolase [Cyanobacteria bacterium SIG28]|nr:alpha/beta fold hydrolase [Cyanobacteria bacterium SIG28]
MRRITFIILALFLCLINTPSYAAQAVMKKEVSAVASDGFNLKAQFVYPKIKNQKEFPTVVLLHSLGYNSQWWEDLPKLLLEKGYAVLTIDLRGHGESVYNARLTKISWKNMRNSAYAKYPNDVVKVIETVKQENPKKIFFNNWAIVGADIGASAGVIASDKLSVRPKTIVMISPVVETKSVYIPVSVAHLDSTDFLSITGTEDVMSKNAEAYLSKFAQCEFMTFESNSKTTGMLMIKNDPQLSKMISEWVSEYLN